MRCCSLVLVLIATVSARLEAQWPADLTSGARMQVRLPEIQYQTAGRRGHLIRGDGGGLLYGGVLGAIFPTERWKRVRLEGGE